MQTEQIIDILYKRLAGTKLSADENAILHTWIDKNPAAREELIKDLDNRGKLAEDYRLRSMISVEAPLREMQHRLGIGERTLLRSKNQFNRKWMAAAAALLIILTGAGVLSYLKNNREPQKMTAQAAPTPLRIENLTPGGSRAILTTSTGDTVHISDLSTVNKKELEKSITGSLSIDVPRGGEFVVTLEDSTRVWLNSESKLTYPSHFDASVRKVELVGEAFFEVAQNPDKPFVVESDRQIVKVYGTEFNIRAYPEDEMIYTTLTEGSVSLSSHEGGGEIFLVPGKQSLFNKTTAQAKIRAVDIERVTGWRHGRFVFDEQTLQHIMLDLARWYNFEYEFADEEAAETVFMGSIPRYSNFKTAIAILEKSGGIIFSVKDNKILISKE